MIAILSAPGSRGDVHPMIGIGRQLVRRGWDVVISLAEPYAPQARAAGLRPEIVIDADRFHSLLADPKVWAPVRGPLTLFRTIAAEFIPAHHDVIRKYQRPGETVLVTHPLDFASRVYHQTHPDTCLVDIQLAPSILRNPRHPPRLTPWAIEDRLPPSLVSLAYRLADRFVVGPLLAPSINRLRDAYGLPKVHTPLEDYWNRSPRCIMLYPPWFAPEVAAGRGRTFAGFPLDDGVAVRPDDPSADRTEVPSRRGVPGRSLVVTAGTANRHARALFSQVAAAARSLQVPTLLLSPFPENVPANLPPQVRVSDYIPLGELLPRSLAIVHHGGIGTTARALAAGIPQLIRPLAFDQFDQAARVERLGVGRWPRRERHLAAALGQLLSDDRLRRNARELARRLTPHAESIARCDGAGPTTPPPSPADGPHGQGCRLAAEAIEAWGRAGRSRR